MIARGFSVIELMASIAIAGLLMLAMQQIMHQAGALKQQTADDNRALQELEFAMQRMLRHARASERLLLPSVDRPMSPTIENIRDETVGVAGISAVFAVTLPSSVDRNGDGIADADNDGDGLLDEDTSADMNNDAKPGIAGIDDDADMQVDEGFLSTNNDDEYLFFSDEDIRDEADSDGDGTADDDWGADNNGDGAPGISGVDDDGDGQTDEGNTADDDEDGQTDEDWLDPVVYFLSADQLIERLPVPWNVDADVTLNGLDYIETPVLNGVSRFRVERVALIEDRYPLVDLTLETTAADGKIRTLHTRIRVGSGL